MVEEPFKRHWWLFLNCWKYPEICSHPTMMRMKNVMKPNPWEWLHGVVFPNLDHYLKPWEWLLARFKAHLSGKLLKILWHQVFLWEFALGCVASSKAAGSNDPPPVRPSRKCPGCVWVITPSYISVLKVLNTLLNSNSALNYSLRSLIILQVCTVTCIALHWVYTVYNIVHTV